MGGSTKCFFSIENAGSEARSRRVGGPNRGESLLRVGTKGQTTIDPFGEFSGCGGQKKEKEHRLSEADAEGGGEVAAQKRVSMYRLVH